MSERRRVTYTQLETLCEFLEDNRDLATGFNKKTRAREAMKKMWQTISQTLNAQGDGAVKDWKGWSKYWNDYKSKLKRTIAKNKRSMLRTGGGPSDIINLSEIERKFLHILGESFGEGLPGIRIDPFDLDGREDSEISQSINTIDLAEADRGVTVLAGPSRDTALAGPSRDAALAEPFRDAALAGPSRVASLAGPSRDAALAGPSRDASLAGPSRVTSLAGPSRDAALAGPSRDAALAGPSGDADLAGPSGAVTQQRQRIRAPRERRRRDLPTSQEAARKALINISNQRASIDAERNEILRELLSQIKELKEIIQIRLPMPVLPETPELGSLPHGPNFNPRPNHQ